jgi:cysteine desulfurase
MTARPIYLDNAASTRVDDRVLALLTDVMRTAWGNPSSPHPQGAAARAYLDAARTRLLAALGDVGGVGDIVWTSGCTEANALAVVGGAMGRPAGTIVTTTIEHPAVGMAVAGLGRASVQVSPEASGVIEPAAMAHAAGDAALATIVMVQNEIGVVQPVRDICEAIRRVNPPCHIHVDAAQALGKVALDVTTLGADTVAIAGHKLHAPKGVGALWVRAGVELAPLWIGGGQQGGRRGGTQDAAGAAALGLAAELAVGAREQARARWLELGAAVAARLDGLGVRQLVPDQRRSPHILALGFPGVPASALRTVLASRGVYIATGSACAEQHARPAAILEAIGLAPDTGMGRLSFGLDTTEEEVTAAAEIIAGVVAQLRAG